MTQEPYERHEHVQISPHYEERVIHDLSAEQRQILNRFTQLIWLVAAVVEVLILIRVMLKLIAANPASLFAQVIYGITDLFLFPFFGLTAMPAAGGSVLEVPALIAMIVYFFAFWVLVKLIWLVFEWPRARSIVTVQSEPVVEERVVYEQPVIREEVVHEEPVVHQEHIVREKRIIHEHDGHH